MSWNLWKHCNNDINHSTGIRLAQSRTWYWIRSTDINTLFSLTLSNHRVQLIDKLLCSQKGLSQLHLIYKIRAFSFHSSFSNLVAKHNYRQYSCAHVSVWLTWRQCKLILYRSPLTPKLRHNWSFLSKQTNKPTTKKSKNVGFICIFLQNLLLLIQPDCLIL